MINPRIYTMPEEFLKDSGVAARWRVWALLNGFFINGKQFWGSNEWIGEQIGVHKDTVSQAVKELEDMKKISCHRTRRSRLINPYVEIGVDAYLREELTPILDRGEHLTISDSNADNNKPVCEQTGILSSEPIIEVRESEEGKEVVSKKRDSTAWKLKEKFYDMFENSKGVRPIPNWGDYKQVVLALKHLTPEQLESMVQYQLDYENPVNVRECITTTKMNKYLQDNY